MRERYWVGKRNEGREDAHWLRGVEKMLGGKEEGKREKTRTG